MTRRLPPPNGSRAEVTQTRHRPFRRP